MLSQYRELRSIRVERQARYITLVLLSRLFGIPQPIGFGYSCKDCVSECVHQRLYFAIRTRVAQVVQVRGFLGKQPLPFSLLSQQFSMAQLRVSIRGQQRGWPTRVYCVRQTGQHSLCQLSNRISIDRR